MLISSGRLGPGKSTSSPKTKKYHSNFNTCASNNNTAGKSQPGQTKPTNSRCNLMRNNKKCTNLKAGKFSTNSSSTACTKKTSKCSRKIKNKKSSSPPSSLTTRLWNWKSKGGKATGKLTRPNSTRSMNWKGTSTLNCHKKIVLLKNNSSKSGNTKRNWTNTN